MTKTILISVATLIVGFTLGSLIFGISQHKKTVKIVNSVRSSWYDAANEAEDLVSSFYADDNANYVEAYGCVEGTACAIAEMNKVLLSIGESPLLLCNSETIEQQIINMADTKRSLKRIGITDNVYNVQSGNPVAR